MGSPLARLAGTFYNGCLHSHRPHRRPRRVRPLPALLLESTRVQHHFWGREVTHPSSSFAGEDCYKLLDGSLDSQQQISSINARTELRAAGGTDEQVTTSLNGCHLQPRVNLSASGAYRSRSLKLSFVFPVLRCNLAAATAVAVWMIDGKRRLAATA